MIEKIYVRKIGDWIAKKDVMAFLDYKETQMREFMIEFNHVLEVSRIGRRVFIKEESLILVLELMEDSNDQLQCNFPRN